MCLQVDKLIQRCQGKAMETLLKRDCAAAATAACDAVTGATCWPEYLNLYENYFEACDDVAGWPNNALGWYETCSFSLDANTGQQ